MTQPSTPAAIEDVSARADTNVVVLRGRLTRDPQIRTLPSGSLLHRYDVTVRVAGQQTDTAPVVWFDPARAPTVRAGDEVLVVGRIRRRFYRSGSATISATEVVADLVSRPTARRAVNRAVDRAFGLIDGARVVSPNPAPPAGQ